MPEQNDTPTERRSGATHPGNQAASLMSMPASVGVLRFRPPHEATFMHRRLEELHCKKDRDAEFPEEVHLVDDLSLNTRKPTLRQHKHVCHLATGGKHKLRLDTKSWLAKLSDECKDQRP